MVFRYSMAEEAVGVNELDAVRPKKPTHKEINEAALEIQLLLLDGVDADEQLHSAGEFLLKSEYANVVMERADVAKICGYSRCTNGLVTAGTRKGRYQISSSAKKVSDLQRGSKFCCAACELASKEFAKNLRNRRDYVKASSKVAKTLKLVRGSQHVKPRPTCYRSGSTSPSSASSGGKQNKNADMIQPESSSLRIVTDASDQTSTSSSDLLPRSSNHTPDPIAKTKANEDSTFSINMSGGRSEVVGCSHETGRIGGKGLADWESLIAATATVDIDSSVDSFASMSLHSGASPSNSKRMNSAAVAAAAGDLDGSEAVAWAGIRVLSACHNATSRLAGNSEDESDDHLDMPQDVLSDDLSDEDETYARELRARDRMRWTEVNRKQNEDDDEGGADDVDYGDQDTDDTDDTDDSEDFEAAREVRFKTYPKGFKAEVSMFGTMFMALEGWISATALAHIYGKERHEEDNFLSVRGREYSRQVVIGNDVSAVALRSCSRRVWRALPEVVRALSISVAMATVESAIGHLVKTMSFVGALPPLGPKQWQVLVLVLLDGLSVIRLPSLESHLLNNPAGFAKVLDSTGITEVEYNVFRDLLLPLGRLPAFST